MTLKHVKISSIVEKIFKVLLENEIADLLVENSFLLEEYLFPV